MKIKMQKANTSDHSLTQLMPTQGSTYAVGYDLRADIRKPMVLHPRQWASVPTGLSVDMPNNAEMQIRPRSGTAFFNGITVLNAPGTIDPDYKDEIRVLLVNHSNVDFTIEPLDRIAQATFNRVPKVNVVEGGVETYINLDNVKASVKNGLSFVKKAISETKTKLFDTTIMMAGGIPTELIETPKNNKVLTHAEVWDDDSSENDHVDHVVEIMSEESKTKTKKRTGGFGSTGVK